MPTDYLTVSEVARRLGVKPRLISDAFYNRTLNDAICPIIARRRMIPPEYVDIIKMALRRAGHLPLPAPLSTSNA